MRKLFFGLLGGIQANGTEAAGNCHTLGDWAVRSAAHALVAHEQGGAETEFFALVQIAETGLGKRAG